jgi:hypothetical protein
VVITPGLVLDKIDLVVYSLPMKTKEVKVRVSPEGFMNSASREHRVKKGKGSFNRKPKHREQYV